MPRRARLIVDGGYYHILTRGIDKRRIFQKDSDYRRFIDIVKNYLEEFEILISHYCLMPNHIHFLLQVLKARDLSKFMQAILQVYASYFRNKYSSVGFVFQNRYKSLWIEKDSYLLECARYIERNPLRAHIVTNPLDYPWSSFPFYVKNRPDDIVKSRKPFYLEFTNTTSENWPEYYYNFVTQERPYDHIIDKAIKIG